MRRMGFLCKQAQKMKNVIAVLVLFVCANVCLGIYPPTSSNAEPWIGLRIIKNDVVFNSNHREVIDMWWKVIKETDKQPLMSSVQGRTNLAVYCSNDNNYKDWKSARLNFTPRDGGQHIFDIQTEREQIKFIEDQNKQYAVLCDILLKLQQGNGGVHPQLAQQQQKQQPQQVNVLGRVPPPIPRPNNTKF